MNRSDPLFEEGDAEQWLLYRAKDHPRIGEFDSEEAAEEFREEHLLIDWKPLRVNEARKPVELFDGKVHEAVCGACDEEWPCRAERVERQAQRISMSDAYRCVKCGKQPGIPLRVPGGGLLGEEALYCGKLGACRTLALKELLRLGHDELYAKYERERQMRADGLARAKARKAQRRATWAAGVEALSERSV